MAAERGSRGNVPGFEDEGLEKSPEELAWEDLFRFTRDAIREEGTIGDQIAWDGIVGEEEATEEEAGIVYFMRMEASEIDLQGRPENLVINLYENGLHSHLVFALADWNQDRPDVLIPQREAMVPGARKEVSVLKLIEDAKGLVEIARLDSISQVEPKIANGVSIGGGAVLPMRIPDKALLN